MQKNVEFIRTFDLFFFLVLPTIFKDLKYTRKFCIIAYYSIWKWNKNLKRSIFFADE